MEQSLTVEFDELFALTDRLRQVADNVRARLLAAGLQERLETDVFSDELELRGTDHDQLVVRLDSFRLDIAGAPPELPLHLVAAILLDEAGAFRLNMVEAGYLLTLPARRDRPLKLIQAAFTPVESDSQEPMLDRRFALTWDWGNATTSYSFHVADTEDRELMLSFKAREGYMTLDDLQTGTWVAEQGRRFDGLVGRALRQLGWQV